MGEKINHNLIVNYYYDKHTSRGLELNHCFLENLHNDAINAIVVICTESDYFKLLDLLNLWDGHQALKNKLIHILTEKRPTFNDYFLEISRLFNGINNINIISNLDIIIPKESLIRNSSIENHNIIISDYLINNKTCLALTRWDISDKDDYKNGAVFFDRPDSQDTWIFRGGIPQMAGAEFGLGLCGCDNSIAYMIEQCGYNVINPSRTIKTYHLHLTNVRNYIDVVGQVIERIPPPYKLLHPTE